MAGSRSRACRRGERRPTRDRRDVGAGACRPPADAQALPRGAVALHPGRLLLCGNRRHAQYCRERRENVPVPGASLVPRALPRARAGGRHSMNCEMAEENLSAYLDDMLDPPDRATIQSHLDGCNRCREVLDDYRRYDTLLVHLPRVAPPDELRARIFESPEFLALV